MLPVPGERLPHDLAERRHIRQKRHPLILHNTKNLDLAGLNEGSRRARDGDLDALLDIERRNNPVPWSRQLFAKELQRREGAVDRRLPFLVDRDAADPIDPGTTIGLVGRKIRTFLPQLSPALSVFEEERIHLVSQAANDLNFSFVIDQEQAARLITKFHASVIRKTGSGTTFGPS